MFLLSAVKQLLVAPKSFFAARGRDELLLGVIPVVLLVGLVTVVGTLGMGWVFARHSDLMFDEVLPVFLQRAPLVLVAVFIGWLLLAGGLHVTSAPAGGEGSFGTTLVVTGWGMVPSVVQNVATVLALSVTLQEQQLSRDPATFTSQVQGLTGAELGPVFVVGALVASAWQGYIWAGGLEQMRDVDRSSARLAAGVVAAVLFLFHITGG